MALSLNIAFARSRFSDTDKQKFMEEVKQGVAAHKIENKGKMDLQIFKPDLYEELDIYYKQEKLTREEMNKIKQNYENFSRAGIAQGKVEEEFYKFVTDQLEEINKTQVVKTKEGQVCNNWSCEDDLKCAPDPRQVDGQSCKKEGRECRDDGDCCSSACTLDSKTKKRYCEMVHRCYRPVNLGGSCSNNPVCAEGECLAFNSNTSGIGECEQRGSSCKKNVDCCSNSCERNKCVESYTCKDCLSNGKKPNRGQKCCEGLYLNEKGMCAPDAPPIVIPQVNIKFDIIDYITAIFIGSAKAADPFGVVPTKPKGGSDSSEMTNVILGDKAQYSNFVAKSKDADKVVVTTPEMIFTRKSDFTTCDIRFRDDFANYLKSEKLVDLELALLSFDYMFLGDGVNDYWTKSNDPTTSIYGRLKTVAKKHQLIRTTNNAKMDVINHKLTCMCLDVIGDDNIKDAAKKSFFEKECDEFKVAQTGEVCTRLVDCTDDAKATKSCEPGPATDSGVAASPLKMLQSCNKDEKDCTCQKSIISSIEKESASGIKGKKLLVNWTQNLVDFNTSLAIDNTSTYLALSEVSTWTAGEAKWNDATMKKFTLFNFDVKNPSNSVAAMGAILGAILAAGVIAVLGGFATSSILTAWAAAGIIGASAVGGGTGLWLIASLRGAWMSKRPEIVDQNIRTYGCGKKETCVEYSRELNQPYNDICKVHTSANACVKNFAVYSIGEESRYLVDPWIPKGVAKALILKDAGGDTYAEKMEKGFKAAKDNMISLKPVPAAGGGKGGGEFVSEDYLKTAFIDADVLGKYTPKIGDYLLNAKTIKEIKDQAKKYAIGEKFFLESDIDNLNKFADYTYQFHFLWPKTSRKEEISYPTVGLTTYLELMSNGVAGQMAVGATKAAGAFGILNTQYLEDYKKTLQLFADQPSQQANTVDLKLITGEIDKTQEDIDNKKVLAALVENNKLDTDLMNLKTTDISAAAKTVGAQGTVTLSTSQKSFLNAIGKLRAARNLQLKRLEAYNKAVNTGDNKDRAVKVASASKNFSSLFSHPVSGGTYKGNAGGSGDENKLNTSDLDGMKSYKSKLNLDDYGRGSSSGSGGHSYSSGSGGSKSDKDEKGSNGNGMSDEDSRRLAAAIEARDRASKDKYQSREDQTIFEKVTNAYIRNYDKILTKKKDKDIVEQK